MHINGKWQAGQITRVWHTPRSYLIETEDGQYRRNSRDVRKRNLSESPNATNSTPRVASPVFEKRTRSGRKY